MRRPVWQLFSFPAINWRRIVIVGTRIIAIFLVSIAMLFAILFAILHFATRYTYNSNDPNDYPEVVDRKPLRYFKDEPNENYMLVRIEGNKFEYIDDFALLRENKDIFIVTNRKGIYFTTAGGHFELYKNNKRIDSELFDLETIKIEYGTLSIEQQL